MDFDISSIYNNYISSTGNTSATSKNVDRVLKSDMSKSSDDELLSACKEFEAYFYEQIFKKMEEAMVPKSDESSGANSTLVDFYKDNLVSEYAKSAADQSSNGLAQMLYEQMKRNYNI